MEVFGKKVKMTMSMVILVVLVLLLVVTFFVYYKTDDHSSPNSLWGPLFGSLAAGLIVAIIQYLIAWQDYKQTEKLKALKLKEVLYYRNTKSKYEEFIKGTNRTLDVMGVTAVRFFRDFADTTQGAPDSSKVLLHALERGVNLRILLPSDKYLPNESKRQDSNRVRAQYSELKKKYQYNLEIRYFNHIAAHSIFKMDDTCIIGPVFPELESKNTPALHVMNSSPMALNYIDYFESEWKQAKQNHV